jgi:DNA polymerase kappa
MGDTQKKALTCFSNDKAGMQGIDKAKVTEIIEEATKNTETGRALDLRQQRVEQEVQSIKAKIESFYSKGVVAVSTAKDELDELIVSIEAERSLEETWIHVDMDMFYAAVEIRDNPALADKPVAVCHKSIIATSNYVARRYGIRSAIPRFIAEKLCPEVILIEGDMRKYCAVGAVIRDIFREYDIHYEALGLDEGHLRVTDVLELRGLNHRQGRQQLALEIRDRITQATRLTCSAGVACNKMLAKMCTEVNKPDGQFYLPFERDAILDYIRGQPVRKVPYIGKVLEKVLNGIGIVTCHDVLDKALELSISLSPLNLRFVLRSALGIGAIVHPQAEERKSISMSRSLRPISDLGLISTKLKEFCEEVARQAAKLEFSSLNVGVGVVTAKFEHRTK